MSAKETALRKALRIIDDARQHVKDPYGASGAEWNAGMEAWLKLNRIAAYLEKDWRTERI